MRGALQYHDAYDLTAVERERINKFISDRMEHEVKKQFPVY
jgi:hypothetical protein